MLDLECFTYLNRALESPISPIVILASNRGRTSIRTSLTESSDLVMAHGIPPDLLARLLIIPTQPYAADEIRTIISLRARTEGLTINEEALDRVARMGADVSLRYALQLLSPASVLAKVAGRQGIEGPDVDECQDLFLDARRSAAILNGREGFIS